MTRYSDLFSYVIQIRPLKKVATTFLPVMNLMSLLPRGQHSTTGKQQPDCEGKQRKMVLFKRSQQKDKS